MNELRREAIRLRIAGVKLAEIKFRTGLSAPTIISAHKAFLAGGWAAVPLKPRGRNSGAGRLLDPQEEAEILRLLTSSPPDRLGLRYRLWQPEAVQMLVQSRYGIRLGTRTAAHYLKRWGMTTHHPSLRIPQAGTSRARWAKGAYADIQRRAKAENGEIHWVEESIVELPSIEGATIPLRVSLIQATTTRGKVRWLAYAGPLNASVLIDFFDRLLADVDRKLFIVFDSMHWQRAAALSQWIAERPERLLCFLPPEEANPAENVRDSNDTAKSESQSFAPDRAVPDLSMSGQLRQLTLNNAQSLNTYSHPDFGGKKKGEDQTSLTHLETLESQSIQIMREAFAQSESAVMLYSMGKDSSVMLHLAVKAFYPGKLPFPLLHIDTTWKFREMYEFRDRMAEQYGFDLLVHINPDGVERNINPFAHGSAIHTDIMKTASLKQALDKYRFDIAFCGARRDEEKSQAKERIFSFRDSQHRWDPTNQRPEPWQVYNASRYRGERVRVYPLSNWTEFDIWHYIYQQNIPVVPLYFAKKRPMVERDDMLIVVDDERMPLRKSELPTLRKVRFRALGCYPLTGAIESDADTVPKIIREILASNRSERQGRIIDRDSTYAMERRKQEGYF